MTDARSWREFVSPLTRAGELEALRNQCDSLRHDLAVAEAAQRTVERSLRQCQIRLDDERYGHMVTRAVLGTLLAISALVHVFGG